MMTASADGTMREWDWESGHPIKSITVHEGENQAVRAMEFFGDGSHMVTAGMDGKVKLWDYQSETCTEELVGDGKAVWVGSKLGEDQLLVTLEAEDDAQYVRILRVSL
jgi:WD40 repeat protein